MQPIKIGEINLRNYGNVDIYRSAYATSPNTPAVFLKTQTGEPLCALSVNMFSYCDYCLLPNEIFIKTYSTNEEIAREVLAQTCLFEDTGKRIASGFVDIEIWRFKE
jgi:hypothetical protein